MAGTTDQETSDQAIAGIPAEGGGQEGPERLTREGMRLSRLGRHSEALDLFTQALTIDPTYTPAWVASGFALGKLGRYKEEIKACDQALALDPTLVDAWINRGFALGKLSRFSEKLVCCERAIVLDPSSAQAWNARGHTLGELGRFEEELTCTEIATSLRPRYVGAWVNRGYALMKLRRFREAVSAYIRALEVYPRFASAWINMGIACCHMGDYARAASCFEEAERIRPLMNVRDLYWKGVALSRSGRRKEAIAILSKVVREDPRHAETWIELSNCHFMVGEIEESVRCFMVAYGIDKQDIRDSLSRAVTLLREGKKDEGVRCLSQALGILLR